MEAVCWGHPWEAWERLEVTLQTSAPRSDSPCATDPVSLYHGLCLLPRPHLLILILTPGLSLSSPVICVCLQGHPGISESDPSHTNPGYTRKAHFLLSTLYHSIDGAAYSLAWDRFLPGSIVKWPQSLLPFSFVSPVVLLHMDLPELTYHSAAKALSLALSTRAF